jgi:hypothetical protein
MLPFLKHKQEGSVSEDDDPVKRKPDESTPTDEYDMLESAAEDMISAIHSRDVKVVCSALRAAFEILDSEPHYEGPHTEEA